MKNVLTISLVLISYSLAICQSQPTFEMVPDSLINQERLNFATKLADGILSAQQKGGFYTFSEDEADPRVIAGLTEAAQKQSYVQIKGLFGDYKRLKFNHLMKSTQEPLYEIYRFKGLFEKEEANVEVRVVLNEEGKLAGYFIKPWKEGL